MTPTHIDPRLRLALEQAQPGALVQAVITLCAPGGKLLSKPEVDTLCTQMLHHAEAEVGTKARHQKVMHHLQTLVLEAEAPFISSVLRHDVVQSAMLNASP